ncbi:MAG TPA: hypothetical protein VMT34_01890 [Aggregatilineales bacterium]|nr:hypothetical protein [Aggregatilineales bacterium]
MEAGGVPVHIGECGCDNRTPNDVARRWFADPFWLFKEFGWGSSRWNFKGNFGIVEHGRRGTSYEDVHGYRIDHTLLGRLPANRV